MLFYEHPLDLLLYKVKQLYSLAVVKDDTQLSSLKLIASIATFDAGSEILLNLDYSRTAETLMAETPQKTVCFSRQIAKLTS
ncbi:MAG: hypothetical protein NW224_06470 [Leptolyngbyaceae cyanobacterium bins.302]|nr:hypothetical protein [Leptolyngbyaceae cyanobacterium bins.302]